MVPLRDHTYVPWFGPRPYERIRLYGPIRAAFYTRYPQKVLPIYRLSETREILYGPMIHLTMHIFGPEEPAANWVLRVALSHGGRFTLTRLASDRMRIATSGWSGLFSPKPK